MEPKYRTLIQATLIAMVLVTLNWIQQDEPAHEVTAQVMNSE